MIFFYLKKISFSFSRYLDFNFFGESVVKRPVTHHRRTSDTYMCLSEVEKYKIF